MHAEDAYATMPDCVEDRMLWPRYFFAAAARVFALKDLLHCSRTEIQAGRLRTLRTVLQPSVHEQLSLVYGRGMTGVAAHITGLLCKHSADLHSILALLNNAKRELPAVVVAAVEYLRITQPAVVNAIQT